MSNKTRSLLQHPLSDPLPKARIEMVEASGRLCQLLGLPKSTGQIYGLLYLSMQPMSLNDIVNALSISKASASNGARQLAAWGAIRQVWVQGDRRDFYEAAEDFSALIHGGYQEYFKPRLRSSRRRIDELSSTLKQEFDTGIITKDEFAFCTKRIKNLSDIQKKVQKVSPLVEKLL